MTRKFAVSVSDELFDLTEEERARLRLSRSGMVQQALAAWVRQRVEERLDEEYAEAYRRFPETAEEIEELKAWSKLGLQTWDDDQWDESMVIWPEDAERRPRVAEVDEADRRGYLANPETPAESAESHAAAKDLFAREEPWE